MRSVLLPMTEHAGKGRLEGVTLDLARAYGLKASLLYIRPDPRSAVPLLGEGLTATTVQDLCNAAETEGAAQAEKIKNKYASDDVSADMSVTCLVGDIVDHVGRRARLSDLSVCAPPDDGDSGEIFDELLFRSGKPLLLVPECTIKAPFDRITVAWNGRAECARALSQSIPFLQQAHLVTLLQIGDIGRERPAVEDAAAYMEGYGVSTTLHKISNVDTAIGTAILDACSQHRSDLLVIGAYSHARWRELIVGGVIRDITRHSTLAVLMSH